jgi:hypothetical protein
MQSLNALPNFSLQPADGVTAPFLALGMRDFHAAARYIYQLPSEVWAASWRITLEVLVHNHRGHAFWRTLGFQEYTLTLEMLREAPLPAE